MKKILYIIPVLIVAIVSAVVFWPVNTTVALNDKTVSILLGVSNEPDIGEITANRTECSKTSYLGNNKYAVDSFISPIHYKDTYGAWQDIDNTYSENDTNGYTARFTKLPYVVRIGNDSGRRIYPDRNDLSYWINIYKPFEVMPTPTKLGNSWTWEWPNASITVTITNSGVKFNFLLKNSNAPKTLSIPFDSQGITRSGYNLYHDGKLVGMLRKPIAIDANENVREVSVIFSNGNINLSLDTTGLSYPIDVDPTIDVQVGAGANDGVRYTGSYGFVVNGTTYLGYFNNASFYHCNNFDRFTNISIAAGSTINAANITSWARSGNTHVYSVIYGCDADNPDAPTNNTTYDALTNTTAHVHWNDATFVGSAWNASPDISTIIQELLSSYTISNDALIILIKSEQTATSAVANVGYYEWSSTGGKKLHIEYTESSASSITNSPSSKAFGVIWPSSTYWSNTGNATGFTGNLTDAQAYFTVTNNGTVAVDITIKGTNWTGGTGWNIVQASPGSDEIRISAYKETDNVTGNVTLTTSAQSFISALAASGNNTDWEIKLETGTAFTDGVVKSTTITLTAAAS